MKIQKVSKMYRDMSDAELEIFIREKLSMDPKWARRALTALYDEQTEAEQADPVNVHESNGRGFSPQDQEFLSSLAKQALAGNVSFSQKQIGWLYTLLPKYSKQMVKLVRDLERMEPTFIFTVFHAQVLINNNKREMEATTGNLGLQPLAMPDNIMVRSVSGDIQDLFKIHDVNVGIDGPQLFIYRGKCNNQDWTLIISVADPDYIPTMEEAIDMMHGEIGVKPRK